MGNAGGPLLAALVSGEAAEAIEKQPAGDAVAEALAVLRGIFEPQGIQVPTPLQVATSTDTALSSLAEASSNSVCFSWSMYSLHDNTDYAAIPGIAAPPPPATLPSLPKVTANTDC